MRISQKQYAQAWYHILKTVPPKDASQYTHAILSRLYKGGRARWLPEILRLIEEYDRSDRGSLKVSVKYAHPIPDEMVMGFIEENLPSKHYDIEKTIVPSLLAGLQIETSDTRWNISLGEKLKQMCRKISPPELHHC